MDAKEKIEDSLEHIGAYVQTRLELVLLNTSDKVAHTIANVVLLFILWAVSGCVVTFLSVGLAWWIGQELQNMPAGFFIVAGAYLLLAVILYVVARKAIKATVINQLLKLWNHDRKN